MIVRHRIPQLAEVAAVPGYLQTGHGDVERYASNGVFAIGPPTAGTIPCAYVFVAPPSGTVTVWMAIRTTSPDVDVIGHGGFELREGMVLGAGTAVASFDWDRAATSTAAGVVTPYSEVVTGLTAGALYHARLIWAARPVAKFPNKPDAVTPHARWIWVIPS